MVAGPPHGKSTENVASRYHLDIGIDRGIASLHVSGVSPVAQKATSSPTPPVAVQGKLPRKRNRNTRVDFDHTLGYRSHSERDVDFGDTLTCSNSFVRR